MIKTPLSTVIGGAFWTPEATVINGKEIFSVFVKSLFANGEQGFWCDPNDLSTMFQDAAGTVPVTGVGQPVGLIRDKSGRNNHAYQATSASRPILRQNATTGANYLEFDGSDDFLQTSNIDFTGTDKVSLFAACRVPSGAIVSTGCVVESSTNALNINGTFCIFRGGVTTQVAAKGTIAKLSQVDVVAKSTVFSATYDLTTPKVKLRSNGSDVIEDITPLGAGKFTSQPLFIGRRGGTSLPFNGHIYGLIGIGKLTTDSETTVIEKEIAKRLGVTLNV